VTYVGNDQTGNAKVNGNAVNSVEKDVAGSLYQTEWKFCLFYF